MSNPYRRIAKRPVTAESARRKTKKAGGSPKRRELAARKPSRFASSRDESLFEGDGTFNPQSYDYDKKVRAAAKSNRRMFDKKGHINAVDKRDALTQISHLLNEVTQKNASKLSFYNPDAEAGMNKDAKRQVLAAALQDPSGRGLSLIAQELALPIKRLLDYEGFARKIFRVRKLAQAELFRIPKDVRATAWIIGQDGRTPRSEINTKWVTPDETKLASFSVIDIADILHLNFDVLDRIQDTARQEIELQEDKRAIAVIEAAATTVNAITVFASLGIGAFEDVRYQVERHRLNVENFLINRQELSDIVKTMSAAVDPVTERELILAGYVGNVLNAQILTAAGQGVEQVIPAGTFYATTGSEYMGEMGIRQELMTETYNEYALTRTTKGIMFLEIVGFGLPNAVSVAKGTK